MMQAIKAEMVWSQVYLQEIAWSEDDKPKAIARRAGHAEHASEQSLLAEEPMFCFQTAVALHRWSCLTYMGTHCHNHALALFLRADLLEVTKAHESPLHGAKAGLPHAVHAMQTSCSADRRSCNVRWCSRRVLLTIFVVAADIAGMQWPGAKEALLPEPGKGFDPIAPIAAGETLLTGAVNGTLNGLVKGAVAPAPCAMPPGKGNAFRAEGLVQDPRYAECHVPACLQPAHLLH